MSTRSIRSQPALQPTTPKAVVPKRSLLDRLGGIPALRAAVSEFYKRLLADPALAPMFDEVAMPLLRTHQLVFMRTAFTEIPDNFDVSSVIVQKHLRLFYDKGLDASHFDLVAAHFVQTLQHLGISPTLVDEVVSIVGPLREAFAHGAQINKGRYFC